MESGLGRMESADLYVPPILDTAEYLQEALAKYFREVNVRVTSCPDLRKEPFNLVSPGLGGTPFILQIGGLRNLYPTPQKDKVYDLTAYAESFNLPSVTLLGAAAGPLRKLGHHSESMVDFRTGERRIGKAIVSHTHVAYWKPDGSRECKIIDKPQISFLGDFYASQGLPGRVLQIKLRQRLTDKGADVLALLRELLIERFGAQRSIGVGGVVLLKRGTVRMHILHAEIPTNPTDISKILRSFDVQGPLVGLCMLMTNDCGIQMNQTHMHMFNHDGGHGGHYEGDVNSDNVEYEAYLSFVARAVHFDAPH